MRRIELKVVNPALLEYPRHATEGAAGVDIRACIDAPMWVNPGQTVLIPTGFAVNLNDPGIAAVLIPRSGLGHKNGIVLGNLVGLIDSDYQGEIKVSLWNRSEDRYLVKPMDRIAQMVIVPVVQVLFEQVDEFSAASVRGAGGFGSTGKN